MSCSWQLVLLSIHCQAGSTLTINNAVCLCFYCKKSATSLTGISLLVISLLSLYTSNVSLSLMFTFTTLWILLKSSLYYLSWYMACLLWLHTGKLCLLIRLFPIPSSPWEALPRCILDLTLQPGLLNSLSYFSISLMMCSFLSNFSRSIFQIQLDV